MGILLVTMDAPLKAMKTRKSKSPICFLVLLAFLSLQGQGNPKIDSLLSLLNQNPNDTVKVDTYLSLEISLLDSHEEKAMDYLHKAVTLSEEMKDARRISLSYLQWARFYDKKGNLQEAQKALSKVEDQLEHFQDTRIEATFFMLRGIIYYFEGTYAKAVADLFQAIPRYEALGDPTTVGSCYLNIGANYVELNNLDQALNYYQKGLDVYKKMEYEKGIAMATGNMGQIFGLKNEFDKALEYYNLSLQVNEKYDYKEEAREDLNNIGVLYEKKGEFKKALEYHRNSLNLAELLDSDWGIANSKYNLAQIEYKLGNYNDAIQALNEVIHASLPHDYKEIVKDAYHSLSQVYKDKGELRLSLEYMDKYVIWKDSLLNENHLKQVAELQTKYETEKKDQQITLLAQEKEVQQKEVLRQATLKNAFIVGAVLIALLSGLLFYTYQQRLKNQKALASKNKEIQEVNFKRQLTELEMKALQAQINPHFIFNCMNSINQMILDGENKNASKYLTKFGKLIRMVLENAESTEVSLKDELSLLEAYIQLEGLRFDGEIRHKIEIKGTIDLENTYLPSMVLQPFVENAVWHGLMHRKDTGNGKIGISIEQEGEQLVCTIEDNGVGRQKAFELQQRSVYKTKSLGLKITEERLKLLSKELHRQLIQITDLTNQAGEALGTRVTVNIPIS